jgi:hypothetical protein
VYTRKNAQVVTNLQQTCSNAVPTTCQQDVQWRKSRWGGGGRMMNFRKFWPIRRLKTAFSSANGEGGLSEIWKFCWKFRRLRPPPEKVNFRHWGCVRTACSQLVDKLPTTACWQLAIRLLSSTDLLQVVPTTCYHPAIQRFVNKLWVTTL